LLHRRVRGRRRPRPTVGARALDEWEREVTEGAMARRRSDPESSETARQTGPVRAWKIQSELHGDMQSQAEMT
jgi:hypothetical protein